MYREAVSWKETDNSSQIHLVVLSKPVQHLYIRKKFKPIDLSGLMTREPNLRNWFDSQVLILIKLTAFPGFDLISSHKLSGRSFVNVFKTMIMLARTL